MNLAAIRTILLVLILIFAAPSPTKCAPSVTAIRVPDGGIQPQSGVDEKGTLHLLYFKGDAGSGDLYYVNRAAGKEAFSKPLKVNSSPGSVVARGSIRGGQMAVGKAGQIFVVWNASKSVPNYEHCLLLSRLNKSGTGFEPERNLLTNKDLEMDGGCTIAADRKGSVFVFFHSAAKGQEDCRGRIYMSKSSDSGRAFSANTAIDTAGTGACPCCSMKAHLDDSGKISVLYRCAVDNTKRDTVLLSSTDSGQSFSSNTIDSWQLNSCPMSMFSLSSANSGLAMAWESDKTIKFANSVHQDARTVANGTVKYPSIALSLSGESLISWTEGCAWNKGGNACWQIYDKDKHAITPVQSRPGVPAWSFTSAQAQPDGSFIILY